ncbi:MAG TPA: translocation/assembly module TamB domain-containing protein, partial [Planctomycetota bacterium]|nr:translocation/assembly module TamB domain-containing protein [Planctomycetota bacterium]
MRLSPKAKRWLAIGGGALAAGILSVWLLRWWILEDRVRAELTKIASDLFDADVKVGAVRGNLLTSIQADDVVLTPRAGSVFREFTIKNLEVGYGLFGTGTLDVRMNGAWFSFARSKSDQPAYADDFLDTAREISRFRFPGRLRATDSVLELPDGPSFHIDAGSIDYGTWRLSLSPAVIPLKKDMGLKLARVEAELEPGRLSLLEAADGGLVVAAHWDREESHLEISWGKPDGDNLAFKGQVEPNLDATLSARMLKLDSPLMRALVSELPLEGVADLEATLGGTPDAPTIDGQLVFSNLRIGEDPVERLVIPLAAEPGALILPRTTHETPVGPVTLAARIPFPWVRRAAVTKRKQPDIPAVDATGQKMPDILPPVLVPDPPLPTAPFDTPTATIEVANVEGILKRLPEEIRPWIPRGRVQASGTIGGDEWKVTATFDGDRYDFPDPVGVLTDYEVEAELTATTLTIRKLKGMLGGGPITATGSVDLSKPGQPLLLELKGTELLVVTDDLARIRINPDVKITVEAGPQVTIKGNVEVPLALYYTEFGPAAPEGGRRRDTGSAIGLRLLPAEGGGFRIPGIRDLERVTLDVRVVSKVKGECRIENSMIGALVEGKLRLRGRASSPGASGRVTVQKGQVRLTSGLFLKINEGMVNLPDSPGREPYIQFEGTVGRFNREIVVLINGPLARPTLRLSSNPPRSQEELLAMIAFGRTPGSVEGTDALG